jgi:hypothetical protein
MPIWDAIELIFDLTLLKLGQCGIGKTIVDPLK